MLHTYLMNERPKISFHNSYPDEYIGEYFQVIFKKLTTASERRSNPSMCFVRKV